MRKPTLALALSLLLALPLRADDGAGSIAAGGIILMKRELRITMAKEVLQISLGKVIVDYDFCNDSDEDITTLVAFPIPRYGYGDWDETFGDPTFSDFSLAINGVPTKFKTEVRAYIGKREVTALLAREHIDSSTFGHFNTKAEESSDPSPDFTRAAPAAKAVLRQSGAYDKDNYPSWKVDKKYYWTQTFPAHGTVHIRHEYSPAIGGSNSFSYGLRGEQELARKAKRTADEAQEIDEVESMCFEPALRNRMLSMTKQGQMVPYNYVDFILTTANTWKTPIEDFTLIVERPSAGDQGKNKRYVPASKQSLVSFCWAGPVEKSDPQHFTAHLTNFVPDKELRIGFLYPGDAYKEN